MINLNTIHPNKKRIALSIALATTVAASTWIGWRLSHATATPPTPATNAPAPAAAPASPSTSTAATEPLPTTVQIVFTTVPPTHAIVTWGKTILGRISPHAPLVVTRPRDSGPLDVIVRAGGYMPVHTRAHTFADTKIGVKLTRPDQKSTLFGYRAPIDAGTPEGLSPSGTGVDLQQPPP
jgi:hypothetical protein